MIQSKQLEVVQNKCIVKDASVCICVGGGVGKDIAVGGYMQKLAWLKWSKPTILAVVLGTIIGNVKYQTVFATTRVSATQVRSHVVIV